MANEEHNTQKVLRAFRRHEIAARHFAPTTGYGYDDIGRTALEALFCDVLGVVEAALVRPQIASARTRSPLRYTAFCALATR